MIQGIIKSLEETCRERCNFKGSQYKSNNITHNFFVCFEICSYKFLKIRNILSEE